MPDTYNMNKGVQFFYGDGSGENYSSISDFGLRLESEIIGFPEANSSLDSYSAFFGRQYELTPVEYGRRRLVFNFGLKGVTWQWPAQIKNLTEKIHGKKFKIVLTSDPDYYYIGRCFVASYERALRIGKVQVIVDAEPYKVKKTATTVTTTTDKLINFTNVSEFDTPGDIVITPTSTSGTMTIYCTARLTPASSNYLTIWSINVGVTGETIHLDGVNKRIYVGTSLVQAEVQRSFPFFKPGVNNVYIRPTSLSVSSTVIKYNERSM